MNFNNYIKEIENAKELVYNRMCDTIKGDCNLCPFKGNCIATVLMNIELDLYNLKEKVEELTK